MTDVYVGDAFKSFLQLKYILKVTISDNVIQKSYYLLSDNLIIIFAKLNVTAFFVQFAEYRIVCTNLVNHHVDGSSILKQQINKSVKRNAQEDICERLAKLIR